MKRTIQIGDRHDDLIKASLIQRLWHKNFVALEQFLSSAASHLEEKRSEIDEVSDLLHRLTNESGSRGVLRLMAPMAGESVRMRAQIPLTSHTSFYLHTDR